MQDVIDHRAATRNHQPSARLPHTAMGREQQCDPGSIHHIHTRKIQHQRPAGTGFGHQRGPQFFHAVLIECPAEMQDADTVDNSG